MLKNLYRDPAAAANVSADHHAALYGGTIPQKVSGKLLGGRVRNFRATYTQGAADGSIGDVVYFGKLPKGASPLPLGVAFFSGGNATATMKIGLAGNDDAFCAATSIAAQGSVALTNDFVGGANLDITADTDVIGTNATAAINAGQKITVWIPYVMND
jgi:hypothetical protein